jgi:hypothetical protein
MNFIFISMKFHQAFHSLHIPFWQTLVKSSSPKRERAQERGGDIGEYRWSITIIS